jgi:signal transduction histidine kinase
VGRVFEPFFTTKPVGEGTGLGLDISWRIVVNRHRGDLRVTSQPGETVFTIRLPLTPPAED